MADFSGIQLVLLAYCALVFAKTMLCFANVRTVLGVLDRRLGSRHTVFRLAVLLIVVPVSLVFILPKLVLEERLSFFFIYPKAKVIRDILHVI